MENQTTCVHEQVRETGTKEVDDFRNYVDSERQDKVEQTYTAQHTYQTVEFGKKMRDRHLQFKRCEMTVWDMGHYLDDIVDNSDPDTEASQLMHALQTAESCRKEFPGEEYDWFHVVAFIHDFGKILLVDDEELNMEAEPQWAVVGDIFPTGCKFSDKIVFGEKSFVNNPDTTDPRYNTKLGIYTENCGLDNVQMAWGHDEYIYQFAKKYSTLPEKALSMLRYHSFYPWHTEGEYMYLCNDKDLEMLEHVKAFNQFDLYSKGLPIVDIAKVGDYYKAKLEKYFGKEPLWW